MVVDAESSLCREGFFKDGKGVNHVKLGYAVFKSWRSDSIKVPFKEQLYWLLGLLLWLLYFNLSVQDWTSIYTPICGVACYLAIVLAARSVCVWMNSGSKREPGEKAYCKKADRGCPCHRSGGLAGFGSMPPIRNHCSDFIAVTIIWCPYRVKRMASSISFLAGARRGNAAGSSVSGW